MTRARMEKLLIAHGYVPFDDPGFISGRRGDQTLSLFTWGNDVHAGAMLLPRRYLVVGRCRLPMVEWERWMPVEEQTMRDWADVVDEFDRVFAPVLDGRAPASTLDVERHRLDRGLSELIADAGLAQRAYRKGVYRIGAGSNEYMLSVSGRVIDARDTHGTVRSLELQPSVTWDDLREWLRALAT